MADNRSEQNYQNIVTADADLLGGRIETGKVYRSQLHVLHIDERGKSISELHGKNGSSLDVNVSANNSIYSINNNLGKSMLAANLGLFLYSVFALVQTKETPELVNYGALGIMVVLLVAYIYWIQKRFDKKTEKLLEDHGNEREKILFEHRQERKEWREDSEKRHQELTALTKESTNAIKDFHILVAKLDARL